MTGLVLSCVALVLLAWSTWRGLRQRTALRRQVQALQDELAQRTEALAESEALRRTLTESSAAALVLADRQGHVLHVNGRWTSMYGYTEEEARALPVTELYAEGPEDRVHVVQALDRDGCLHDHELHLRRKDGSTFWGLLDATTVSVGGESLIASWVMDITERHVAAENQRALAGELDLLLQNLQVGIVYTGDGCMLRANRHFADMFGFAQPADVVGLTTSQLFESEAERQRLGALAGPTLAADNTASAEWRARRQDGSVFDAYARARAIKTARHHQATIWMIDDITERKRSEAALRESEAFNRMLFRESTIAMAVYDPAAHRFVDGNDAAARLYGLPDRDALIGKSVWDVSELPPSGGPTLQALTDYLDHGADDGSRALQIEWPHRRPGGQAWIADTHVVRYGYQGRTLLQFTLIDVTAARAAQQAVAELSSFLQRMIDHMPNAVFYKGPDLRLLGCNAAFEQMFGFSLARMRGKRVDEMEDLPADLRQQLQQEDERVLATAATVQREALWTFADGKEHRTLYSVNGFRRPDGSPGGIVGTVIDVEPLKAAEDALRVAHAAQMAVFETASVGICILRDGVVLRCNRELERIFGYGPGELDQQRTRLWYPSDAAHASGRALANARIGSGQRHDQQLRRKNGELFWCRMQARYIDPNSTHGSVWVMEDVTEENAAAEALRQAKRLADEAVATKSMFLANMSHEIRTPMNAIIGLSHLALKTDLNPRQRDYVGKVHSAGTQLLRVVNDVLDFSRLEAGRMEIESAPFRMADVLQGVATTLGDKSADKGLALQMHTDPALPALLLGDPRRLSQVITNLVGNAIKFTAQGQVQVRATQLSRTADALALRVQVEDSGIGMSEAQCAHLFQPFSQVDGTATRRYGGTGLGLTICQRLVQAMGGQIEVQSTPGQGSVFSFTLPLRWRDALDAEHDAPAPHTAWQQPADDAAPALPSPQPPGTALPQVAGLDTVTGLSRAAGNHALYRQLLQEFVQRQSDAPARVAQALAAGEPAAAQRAAYTVRAVAGNLGLGTVQQAASALEQALAHGHAHAELLQAFETQLHAAMQSLGAALREDEAQASSAAAAAADAAARAKPASAAPVDPALAAQHAATLARLLAADDAEAADFFAAQRDTLRALLDAPALAALDRALADFDLDAALQRLQVAAQARGVTL